MLHGLSDQELHQKTLFLRKTEKEAVSKLIDHLREIKRRRLFSDFNCSSLHTYCVNILGYSDGEAWARVKSAELIEEMPHLSLKIETGKLSLTSIAQVKQLFDIGDFAIEKKESIVKLAQNKSTREVKKLIDSIAIESGLKKAITQKSRRQTVSDKTKLTVFLDESDIENLQFVKSKLNIKDDRDLLKFLLKERREKLDPAKKVVREKTTNSFSAPRSISPYKKHKVYQAANTKCTKCGSVFALNIDHRLPVALGGGNEITNLRLLCRSCNQREAVKSFGAKVNLFFS